MDELLALIAQADDEEDVVVQFRGAAWSDSSMSLRLAISVLDSPPHNWHVQCEGVLAYQLNGEGSRWLELLSDHPLLWEFKCESASAYFYRAPANADAAVGALYDAHRKAVGAWIRFGRYLNNEADLVKLLSAGNGLLAQAPMPLLALYKDTLRLHGLELDIRFAHPPRIWNGSEWQDLPLENATKALVLGTSYVIGDGWKAEKIDDALTP
jgi:hypothetical protein